jgi:hypothetical protein
MAGLHETKYLLIMCIGNILTESLPGQTGVSIPELDFSINFVFFFLLSYTRAACDVDFK